MRRILINFFRSIDILKNSRFIRLIFVPQFCWRIFDSCKSIIVDLRADEVEAFGRNAYLHTLSLDCSIGNTVVVLQTVIDNGARLKRLTLVGSKWCHYWPHNPNERLPELFEVRSFKCRSAILICRNVPFDNRTWIFQLQLLCKYIGQMRCGSRWIE